MCLAGQTTSSVGRPKGQLSLLTGSFAHRGASTNRRWLNQFGAPAANAALKVLLGRITAVVFSVSGA